MVVDEPLHLFGQNTAPAPGEVVLSALGACLGVGITAVATWKNEAVEAGTVSRETSAIRAPGAVARCHRHWDGLQAIRVKVVVDGDARARPPTRS